MRQLVLGRVLRGAGAKPGIWLSQHPRPPPLPLVPPTAPLQVTGALTALQAIKPVVQEPRKAGADFDQAIRQYYATVAAGKGGLFIAVCRGKVGVCCW